MRFVVHCRLAFVLFIDVIPAMFSHPLYLNSYVSALYFYSILTAFSLSLPSRRSDAGSNANVGASMMRMSARCTAHAEARNKRTPYMRRSNAHGQTPTIPPPTPASLSCLSFASYYFYFTFRESVFSFKHNNAFHRRLRARPLVPDRVHLRRSAPATTP